MTKWASSTKGIKAFSVIKEPTITKQQFISLLFKGRSPGTKHQHLMKLYETHDQCHPFYKPTIQHHPQSTHKRYTILYQTHYFWHYMKFNSHQVFRSQGHRKSLHKDQQKSSRDNFKTRSILHVKATDLCSCGWTKLRF